MSVSQEAKFLRERLKDPQDSFTTLFVSALNQLMMSINHQGSLSETKKWIRSIIKFGSQNGVSLTELIYTFGSMVRNEEDYIFDIIDSLEVASIEQQCSTIICDKNFDRLLHKFCNILENMSNETTADRVEEKSPIIKQQGMSFRDPVESRRNIKREKMSLSEMNEPIIREEKKYEVTELRYQPKTRNQKTRNYEKKSNYSESYSDNERMVGSNPFTTDKENRFREETDRRLKSNTNTEEYSTYEYQESSRRRTFANTPLPVVFKTDNYSKMNKKYNDDGYQQKENLRNKSDDTFSDSYQRSYPSENSKDRKYQENYDDNSAFCSQTLESIDRFKSSLSNDSEIRKGVSIERRREESDRPSYYEQEQVSQRTPSSKKEKDNFKRAESDSDFDQRVSRSKEVKIFEEVFDKYGKVLSRKEITQDINNLQANNHSQQTSKETVVEVNIIQSPQRIETSNHSLNNYQHKQNDRVLKQIDMNQYNQKQNNRSFINNEDKEKRYQQNQKSDLKLEYDTPENLRPSMPPINLKEYETLDFNIQTESTDRTQESQDYKSQQLLLQQKQQQQMQQQQMQQQQQLQYQQQQQQLQQNLKNKDIKMARENENIKKFSHIDYINSSSFESNFKSSNTVDNPYQNAKRFIKKDEIAQYSKDNGFDYSESMERESLEVRQFNQKKNSQEQTQQFPSEPSSENYTIKGSEIEDSTRYDVNYKIQEPFEVVRSKVVPSINKSNKKLDFGMLEQFSINTNKNSKKVLSNKDMSVVSIQSIKIISNNPFVHKKESYEYPDKERYSANKYNVEEFSSKKIIKDSAFPTPKQSEAKERKFVEDLKYTEVTKFTNLNNSKEENKEREGNRHGKINQQSSRVQVESTRQETVQTSGAEETEWTEVTVETDETDHEETGAKKVTNIKQIQQKREITANVSGTEETEWTEVTVETDETGGEKVTDETEYTEVTDESDSNQKESNKINLEDGSRFSFSNQKELLEKNIRRPNLEEIPRQIQEDLNESSEWEVADTVEFKEGETDEFDFREPKKRNFQIKLQKMEQNVDNYQQEQVPNASRNLHFDKENIPAKKSENIENNMNIKKTTHIFEEKKIVKSNHQERRDERREESRSTDTKKRNKFQRRYEDEETELRYREFLRRNSLEIREEFEALEIKKESNRSIDHSPIKKVEPIQKIESIDFEEIDRLPDPNPLGTYRIVVDLFGKEFKNFSNNQNKRDSKNIDDSSPRSFNYTEYDKFKQRSNFKDRREPQESTIVIDLYGPEFENVKGSSPNKESTIVIDLFNKKIQKRNSKKFDNKQSTIVIDLYEGGNEDEDIIEDYKQSNVEIDLFGKELHKLSQKINKNSPMRSKSNKSIIAIDIFGEADNFQQNKSIVRQKSHGITISRSQLREPISPKIQSQNIEIFKSALNEPMSLHSSKRLHNMNYEAPKIINYNAQFDTPPKSRRQNSISRYNGSRSPTVSHFSRSRSKRKIQGEVLIRNRYKSPGRKWVSPLRESMYSASPASRSMRSPMRDSAMLPTPPRVKLQSSQIHISRSPLSIGRTRVNQPLHIVQSPIHMAAPNILLTSPLVSPSTNASVTTFGQSPGPRLITSSISPGGREFRSPRVLNSPRVLRSPLRDNSLIKTPPRTSVIPISTNYSPYASPSPLRNSRMLNHTGPNVPSNNFVQPFVHNNSTETLRHDFSPNSQNPYLATPPKVSDQNPYLRTGGSKQRRKAVKKSITKRGSPNIRSLNNPTYPSFR